MSEELNRFVVLLTFTRGGDVDMVHYSHHSEDMECEYEEIVSLDAHVDDLVLAHLKHMSNEHGIRSDRRCTYQLDSSDGPLSCIRDPHGTDIRHHFEL